jgi:hypothetical protein
MRGTLLFDFSAYSAETGQRYIVAAPCQGEGKAFSIKQEMPSETMF